MKALIVCQSGPGIGLGHLKRSIVVANLLSDKFDMTVKLLIQGEKFNITDLDKFYYEQIEIRDNLYKKIKEYEEFKLVFFDLSPENLPRNFLNILKLLKSEYTKTIAIDSLLNFHEFLDKIFIPSFFFENNSSIDMKKVVFGWDCFLIDDSYVPSRWKPGNKILILSGGADESNLGKRWPTILNNKLPNYCEITWVRGPFANKPKIPNKNNFSFIEKKAPDNLKSIMAETNYAITVYGVSFFELLKLGIPTIVFASDSNKKENELNKINDLNIAMVAKNESNATDMLIQLMNNDALANKISIDSSQMIKHSGIKKLCSEIQTLLIN